MSTLTAIDNLMYDSFEVSKVLVIAPKRVTEDTWTTEAEKWDHLNHLKISRVLGTANQRKIALKADADIYVINRENVVWLLELCGRNWPFDMVVIDELSSFKSHQSKRFKALRKVRPLIRRIIGLTGTPAPNSLIDLWPQLYLLDRGERLEKTIGGYRDRYFYPGQTNGYTVYSYELKPGADDAIHSKISDICISMKAKDYLNMPELIINDIDIRLDQKTMTEYKRLEREKVLELDGNMITAVTAAAVCNKLLQLADGCMYDNDGQVIHLHDKKLEALEEIIEAANGHPVLVFYNYRFELDLLKNRFGGRTLDGQADIKAWNAGQIPLLLAQPASMGHGLNLQAGGHILVWYGLNWSLELYQQANARLYRQGQTETVIIHRLIAKGTMDEQVIKRLEQKDIGQESLIEAVKVLKTIWC